MPSPRSRQPSHKLINKVTKPGPNLIILTNKMKSEEKNRVPKYLYLNGWTWYNDMVSSGVCWERRRAEKEWERRRNRESLLEQLREVVQGEELRKLTALLELLSKWEQWRESERMRDGERRREVKFLGFWVVLFVLICDCFVINLLERICSLSDWFLVCLKNNNVIYGEWFYLEPMFNWIYQNFCLLVKRICQIFVIRLKLFFFFFFFFLPLLPLLF